MAKLSKLAGKKPIPLSFEGVFIKNLPAKVIEEKFGDVEGKMQKDQEAVIVDLFTNLICDKDGKPFEDCTDFDSIVSVLSVTDIHSIVSAIPEALAPSPKTLGK